jgi:hypothetical protein
MRYIDVAIAIDRDPHVERNTAPGT